MPRQHNTLLDWLRALAIVMVATVHTWSLAHIDASVHSTLAWCYRMFHQCGVPLFVMISGALQISSPIGSMKQFYRKRYIRILVPFFIWSTIVYIISGVVGKYSEVNSIVDGIICYVPFVLTNRINEAYWFIGLIIMLYAVTPFLQRALQACSRQALIGICTIWLIYVIVRRLYPELYLLQYTSRLTYYLGFYILGYLLYLEWGIVWRPKENKLIRAVSDCSFMTYLMHMIFITPFYMLIGFDGSTAPMWQLILVPISTSIIVVTICTVGGVLFKKICPLYNYLGIN